MDFPEFKIIQSIDIIYAWEYYHVFLGLEKIIREQRVLYGKNLDITSYDGKRETHNPEGI